MKLFPATVLFCSVFLIVPSSNVSAANYNTDDIAVINNIIDTNGLTLDKSPTDGSTILKGWMSIIIWTSDDTTEKRVTKINVPVSNMTGAMNLSGLTSLKELVSQSNSVENCDFTALTRIYAKTL
ncbi:hypothetical protein [Clostridium sp.]|uniref:hypothetical protein n=1 Tax=Clostridium sp. TaxID=1506 RepID=UPI002FDCAA15